jgi:hypothetical protein
MNNNKTQPVSATSASPNNPVPLNTVPLNISNPSTNASIVPTRANAVPLATLIMANTPTSDVQTNIPFNKGVYFKYYFSSHEPPIMPHKLIKLVISPFTRVILFADIDLTGVNHVIDNNTSQDITYILNPAAQNVSRPSPVLQPMMAINALIVGPSANSTSTGIIEAFSSDFLYNYDDEYSSFWHILFIILIIFIILYFIKSHKLI